jgi:hypothetical protein
MKSNGQANANPCAVQIVFRIWQKENYEHRATSTTVKVSRLTMDEKLVVELVAE